MNSGNSGVSRVGGESEWVEAIVRLSKGFRTVVFPCKNDGNMSTREKYRVMEGKQPKTRWLKLTIVWAK